MKLQFTQIPATQLQNKISNQVILLEQNIKDAKYQNIKYDVYNAKLSERTDILRTMIMYKAKIEQLMKTSQALAAKYRNQRIAFLEQEIEKNLDYLLPDEKFKVKIEFKTIGDRYYAEMYIGDGFNWSLPKTKNGRFIRQIISFSAMYSVNKLRGSKVIFYDEALSSADKTSLTELKELMNGLIDEGFQIIMIEHKEELYNQLDRKEFHLYKNREEGFTKVIKEEIIDVESNQLQ